MAEVEKTLRFKEFAASCGVPVHMSGKIAPGADLKLDYGGGLTDATPFTSKQEFKVGVGAVWACGEDGMLFEGTVKTSLVAKFSVGSTVVGIASPEASPLVSNVSNPIDMNHFMASYDEVEGQNLLKLNT